MRKSELSAVGTERGCTDARRRKPGPSMIPTETVDGPRTTRAASSHSRYHNARNEVLKWQAEIMRHRPQLAIIGAPVGYFQEPEAIASVAPSFFNVEECDAFNTKFGHKVADIETKATTIKDYCQQWTRLTLEQQNRKLIMAIADRI